MRVSGMVTSVSWIPSESVEGWLKSGFDLGLSHYDQPPLDRLSDPRALAGLHEDDRFRFANRLSGWAEFDGSGARAGYADDSELLMGSTTVRFRGVAAATFLGFALPVLRAEPEVSADTVVLTQTVGGRTGVPLPRPVKHPPYVRWHAPIVWTTLRLTLHRDGRQEGELSGASAFPRHWVYDGAGALAAKSGMTQLRSWMDHSFGDRTPWGQADSPALTVAAESAAERALSGLVMSGESAPTVTAVSEGTALVRQDEAGSEVFLVLDGVLDVVVDGQTVAELGPGAIVGERAVLEGGRRTASVVARTAVRVAVVDGSRLDPALLEPVAREHRREEQGPAGEAE